LDPLENSEIKRHPIGNQGSRKNLSSGKEMRTGMPVTA